MATRSINININGREVQNSIQGISKELSSLRRQYRTAEIGSKEYNEAARGIQEATKLLEKHTIAKRGLITATQTLVGVMGGLFAGRAIFQFFSDATKVAGDFEASLSSLSSITGATGSDLEFYAEQAKMIGTTTTLSASQAVEAFKLIGSARPELLKNKEALAAVTEQAVILAEAAGIDMPTAANSLAGALNQFQLPSEDAARVINALAAGSKEGATAIPDLTASLDKFGVAASAFNVSFEESVGLVELLGEYSIKGAEAGTGLRNVMSIMASAEALPEKALQQLRDYGVNTDIVSDKTLTMEERLTELSKISEDATALTQVFGRENAIVGQVVLQNVDKFAKYTDAVTGTNVAVEQAAINTDNYQGDIKGLQSAFEGTQIAIGNFITNALRPLVQTATAALMVIQELPRFIEENKITIIALASAIVLWNAQLIAANLNSLRLAAAEKGRMILTRAVTIAQHGLNAAMTANPVGLVIKAIALLGAGFAIAYEKSETFRAGLSGLWTAVKEIGTIVMETFKGFGAGFQQIMDGDITAGLKTLGKSIVNTNPIGLALQNGKRLGEAFTKGYKEKLADEKAKKEVKAATEELIEAANEVIKETPSVDPTAPDDDDQDKPKGQAKEVEDTKAHLQRLQEAYDKAAENARMKRLEGEDKILADIASKYDKEIALAKELEAKGVTEATALRIDLEKLKEDEVSAALAEYRDQKKAEEAEARKKIEDEIFKATADEMELRYAEMDAFYGRLAEQAELSGIDTTAILEKWRAEQLRIGKEYIGKELEAQQQANVARMQSYQQLFTGVGTALTGAMQLMAGEEGRFLEFQKIASLAQIAFDTGVAISGVIAAASSTSITPIDLAIKIAGGIGVILANIVAARSAISGATVPQYFTGGYHNVTGETDGRNYNAQYIGRPMTGMLPSRPVLLASERGPEYFVSNRALQNPAVANYVRMIDNIANNRVRQYATGGFTEQVPGAAATAQMDPAMMQVLMDIRNYLSMPPTAIVPDRTIIGMEKRRKELNSASRGFYG